MSDHDGRKPPELPTVLVAVSPELVAMLQGEWSEPVQIQIQPVGPEWFGATLGATHEMVAIRHTCVPDERS